MIASIAESRIAGECASLASVRSSATSTSRAATTMPAPMTSMSEMMVMAEQPRRVEPAQESHRIQADEHDQRSRSGADRGRMAE